MKLTEVFHSGIKKSISLNDAVNWCRTYAPKGMNAIQGDLASRIYRSITDIRNVYMQMNSSGMSGRKSANTLNTYTLCMDNFPEWNGYPKRNKSYICATYNAKVRSFRPNSYLIVPKDSVLLGVCSRDDIWFSFPYLLKKVE